ncbi:MAG TPA: tetratricopeptide repeat protein, partial [Pyrinomonadaceae bacterium]|nr:tetratricopeptide repeat protein [Pyrinomonadaceae bacterium]
VSANPLAQSQKFPTPTTYVSDFAGVIDAETKSRLESLLQKLKEKSKIELYVATVESTGEQAISAFSQQLANEWNIGSRTSRSKSLLLVISTGSKTSFTQSSRTARAQLPEGVLGEMTYRMQGPLSEGRFTAAVDGGVHVFVNALAEKLGFNAAELEGTVVAAASPEVAGDAQPVLISATNEQSTRPRVVRDAPKPSPEATPPAETPQTEPTPTETPAAEPTPSESPKTEPVLTELPKVEAKPAESPKPSNTGRRKASATTKVTPVKKKTPAEIAEEEADEEEEVELTLTLPLDKRAVRLREFLDTKPNSKFKPRAIELLISTHAGLGDQKLKAGDIAGGTDHFFKAIEAADASITDQLFAGVVSQIPMNLYLRGERAAAFKAAQQLETKFGSDPKRLLALAGFYLGIERAAETVRLAESVVKVAPDLAEAHRTLAVGLHISLRLDEAIAEYKKTLELDPSSKVARGSLADLYRATGKTEEALSLYNEQLAADPKDRGARAGKVIALLELGRTEEANSALETTLAEEPRNLALLTGAAYWMTAHGNHEKGVELARKAVEIESRYTWAQIALARSLLGMQRPLDAERALRYARQYGKFPTLTYELASVLSSMGLYDEAVEILRESFTIKDGEIRTNLAGHVPASGPDFLELLAPERRAGIYQPKAAETPENAKNLKALLAFNTAITTADGEKINESAAVAAAQDFAAGTDNMRAFRQVYAASRLLRHNAGISTVLDLVAEAKKASDDAVKVPMLTMAVQADEFRDLRARAISAGNVPDVADAPQHLLANILKGRLEDLHGWALFNQDKYTEAISHLKQAAEILPAETPAWRTALWHLGVAHEQSGQKEQALNYYIRSYRAGPVETVRRSVIEQLYKTVNGSLDGLEERLSGTAAATGTTTAAPASSSTPEPAPVEAPKPEETTTTPAPAATPTPESSQLISEDSLKSASSRLRSNIKITGRISDENKVGLANVVVVLISPSGSVMAATTDNEGLYSFTVAPSQKSYRVIPSKDGYAFTPIDRAFASLFEDQKGINFTGTRQ